MAPRNSNRDNDEDAPWLAEAAPASRTVVSRRSLFWTLFIVLALATIAVVGLVLLMSKKDGGSTQGYMNAEQAPVITAEPGPYKVAPADPAGMRIDGLDGTMYTAGEGIDQGSAIDQSLAPEAPLPRPGAETGPPRDLLPEAVTEPATSQASVAVPPAPATTKPVPAAVPAATRPPTPKPLVTLPKPTPAASAPPPAPAPPAAAKAGSIQLGAFSSPEKADAAWAQIAGKHGLSGKRVIAVTSGDKTLYRLRAASGDPAATCAKLKAAGDACAVVE